MTYQPIGREGRGEQFAFSARGQIRAVKPPQAVGRQP